MHSSRLQLEFFTPHPDINWWRLSYSKVRFAHVLSYFEVRSIAQLKRWIKVINSWCPKTEMIRRACGKQYKQLDTDMMNQSLVLTDSHLVVQHTVYVILPYQILQYWSSELYQRYRILLSRPRWWAPILVSSKLYPLITS